MGAPREIIIIYKSKVRGVLRAWQVMVFFFCSFLPLLPAEVKMAGLPCLIHAERIRN